MRHIPPFLEALEARLSFKRPEIFSLNDNSFLGRKEERKSVIWLVIGEGGNHRGRQTNYLLHFLQF